MLISFKKSKIKKERREFTTMESTKFFKLSQKLQALSKNKLVELLSKMNNNNIEEDIEVKSKEQLINLIMIKASNFNPNQQASFYKDIEVMENSIENKIDVIMEKIGGFGIEGMYLVLALLTQESAKTNQKENHERGDEELRNELLKIIQETINKLSTDQIAKIAELFKQKSDLAKEIMRRLINTDYIVSGEDLGISKTNIMIEGENLKTNLRKEPTK